MTDSGCGSVNVRANLYICTTNCTLVYTYFTIPQLTCHPEPLKLMGVSQKHPSKNFVLATERSGVEDLAAKPLSR